VGDGSERDLVLFGEESGDAWMTWRGDELEDEVGDPGGDFVDGAEGSDAISEEAGGAEVGERAGEVEAAEGEVDGDGGEDGFGEGGRETSEEGGDLLGDGIVGGSACVTDGELT
jgi:hypothetical protein